MKDILAEIVEDKKEIVAAAKHRLPLHEVKKRMRPGTFSMAHRFRGEDWSLIAECKLQSPAKGRLCRKYSVDELARIYAANGASMLSVHTDPHFLGCNEDFQRVRSLVELPLLRKDFVIDAYQLYEARMLGADAVLLIARILSPEQLKEYVYTAWGLGMDALVEVHDEADMKSALQTPAEFIGINNRNLKTFEVTMDTTKKLSAVLPKDFKESGKVLVSESGVSTDGDISALKQSHADAFLIGTALMESDNPGTLTKHWKEVYANG